MLIGPSLSFKLCLTNVDNDPIVAVTVKVYTIRVGTETEISGVHGRGGILGFFFSACVTCSELPSNINTMEI